MHTPGSVRPFTIVSGPEIFLFYEQYTLLSLFKNSSMQLKKGTVTGCDITWEWGSSTVLAPTLEWEKIGTERVGNPFVYQHPTTNKFMMYYSASSVHLEDSDIDEPIYLGAAVADRIEGPYTRVSDEPLVVNGIDEIEVSLASFSLTSFSLTSLRDDQRCVVLTLYSQGEKHMGIGSLKFIRGLGGDGQQTTWALLNRVSLTTATGHTGSTISLVTSDDEGKSFTIEDTTLIAPPLKMDGGWKDTYVYGFDTAVDPDDDNFVKVYYNARDGYAHASEAIGVSRLSKSKVGGGARDESSPPTPTPACQANLCHLCVPDERGGAGTCCDETNSCVYDKVFKEYICLPDYEWIC